MQKSLITLSDEFLYNLPMHVAFVQIKRLNIISSSEIFSYILPITTPQIIMIYDQFLGFI